jgi:hypothetical protein
MLTSNKQTKDNYALLYDLYTMYKEGISTLRMLNKFSVWAWGSRELHLKDIPYTIIIQHISGMYFYISTGKHYLLPAVIS